MIDLRLERASAFISRLRRLHTPTAIATVVVAVVLILGSSTAALAYYADRILPGITVSGIKVGGLTAPEARARLAQALQNYQVSFSAGEQRFVPSLSELGISLELEKTVEEVAGIGHRGSMFDRLGDWWSLRRPERELRYRFDEKRLDAYVASLVETTSRPAVNAKLEVRGDQVVIVPEVPGQATGVEGAERLIEGWLRDLRSFAMMVGQKRLEPAIKASDLPAAKAQAESLLIPQISLVSGGLSWVPDRVVRAAWLGFSEDPEHKTAKVTVDSAKLQGYLYQTVVPRVAYPALSRQVSVNVDEGGAEILTREGREGLAVDVSALSAQISQAMRSGVRLSAVVPTKPVAYATETKKIYNRWVEVDISEQRLYAWNKDQQELNVLISSGTYLHPTPLGTFYIYAKTRSQTMKGGSRTAGDYYELPNVEWINWFYGDYSTHGTYWHNNFGKRMSHGCINMTIAHAQFLYEWAPIGTPVVVHD